MPAGKGLLAILAKPKGGAMPPKGDGDEGGGMESVKMSAAEDIIAATSAKDPKMLADAFTRMYDACKTGGGPEEEY